MHNDSISPHICRVVIVSDSLFRDSSSNVLRDDSYKILGQVCLSCLSEQAHLRKQWVACEIKWWSLECRIVVRRDMTLQYWKAALNKVFYFPINQPTLLQILAFMFFNETFLPYFVSLFVFLIHTQSLSHTFYWYFTRIGSGRLFALWELYYKSMFF